MPINKLSSGENDYRSLFQLVLGGLIFSLGGILVVFIKLDATAVVFYRMLIASAVIFVILKVRKQSFYISKIAIFYAGLSGVFLALDLMLWHKSIYIIGPGIATILNSLQVFVMAIFGILLYREGISLRLFISLLAAIFGVVLLSGAEINSVTNGLFGVVSGILSAVAFAASMLFLKKAVKYQTNSLMNTIFYTSLIGGVSTLFYIYPLDISLVLNDMRTVFYLLLYGSVIHVFAWVLIANAIPKLPLTITGLVLLFDPVGTLLIDLAFLGKQINLTQVIGTLIIIIAVYVGAIKK